MYHINSTNHSFITMLPAINPLLWYTYSSEREDNS